MPQYLYDTNIGMNTDSSLTETRLVDFRRHVRALEREVVRELEAETQCCGVTVAQCHLLLELSDSTLSLTGLASFLDLDASTVSRTVDSLVRAGLVERAPDLADRRSVRLALTAAGRQKVSLINSACNRYYAELLGELSAAEREHVVKGVSILGRCMQGSRHKADGCLSAAPKEGSVVESTDRKT
jgi:DNA-binding MarR family transcriptional regulator